MSTFSRQHYLFAAQWLKDNIPSEQYRADMVDTMSRMFKSDNPRYNEVQFYENAGVIDWLVETNQIFDPRETT